MNPMGGGMMMGQQSHSSTTTTTTSNMSTNMLRGPAPVQPMMPHMQPAMPMQQPMGMGMPAMHNPHAMAMQ